MGLLQFSGLCILVMFGLGCRESGAPKAKPKPLPTPSARLARVQPSSQESVLLRAPEGVLVKNIAVSRSGRTAVLTYQKSYEDQTNGLVINGVHIGEWDGVGVPVVDGSGDLYAIGCTSGRTEWIHLKGGPSRKFLYAGPPMIHARTGQIVFAGWDPKPGLHMVFLNGQRFGGEYTSAEAFAFSPNGRYLAFVASPKRLGEQCVVLNGTAGKRFTNVGSPVVGNNGSVAYVVSPVGNNQEAVVWDGALGAPYDSAGAGPLGVGESALAMNANGTVLAYAAQSQGTWFVVVNGQEGAKFDWVSNPIISDSGIVAYAARDAETYSMVLGEEVLTKCEKMGEFAISADGQDVLWMGRVKGDWLLFQNEKAIAGPWSGGTKPMFGPGNTPAAIGRKGGKSFLWNGGKSGPLVEQIVAGPFFAENYVAYATWEPPEVRWRILK